AVRLGEGTALALSPDGRWALATVHGSKTKLQLLPTGPGEPRSLDLSRGRPEGEGSFGLAQDVAVAFFPDSKGLVGAGFEKGHGKRLYAVDLAGGEPRAIGPEGAFFTNGAHRTSPDGKYVPAFGPDEMAYLFPLVGGPDARGLPIPGVKKDEEVLSWC